MIIHHNTSNGVELKSKNVSLNSLLFAHDENQREIKITKLNC